MLRASAGPCLVGLLWSFLSTAAGQTPAPQDQAAAEMTTHDTPATFRAKVNLVLVPVVVRDKQGRAVGNLRKEDFQLFDKGKPQTISTFSIETLDRQAAAPAAPVAAPAGGLESPAPNDDATVPKRFIAYFFDDVHISEGDLMQVRAAAQRHIQDSLVSTDRAAIFTTSGRTTLDFTDDRAKLQETLLRLRPQPIARASMQECPDIGYYQADLIENNHDPSALQAALLDALECMRLDPNDPQSVAQARTAAQAVASSVLRSGETESRLSLNVFRELVRRLSTMPGQRSIIFISPGFLTLPEFQQQKTETIDRAIRANVIINALNARGLFSNIPGGDASRQGQSPVAAAIKSQYESASALAEEDLMSELAYGTGGVFFHNSNDLVEGFQRVAARPEFIYVLGFSPQNLKLDGRFHGLKITVKTAAKVDLQARRGYYAPQHLSDPEETAKQEIQDALFSREELRDIPVEMRTQFFKSSVENARLAVLARVDVKRLRFRKENGRNLDNLTIVSGVFDRNGNLVTGIEKKVEMHLKDQTLESGRAITVRNTFDLKPGTYLVRLVVRDSEGQLMAAANGTVDIPMN